MTRKTASETEEKTEQSDEKNVTDSARVAMADGGLEVRSIREFRPRETLVRHYNTPPGGYLYAYQSNDSDHHIVVSRGSEPRTRWEERTPATVERPVPRQKRWTIPDNWERHVFSRRDTIAYALYYVPESDVWARVSIPTHDHLVDAWYFVGAVGDLDVEPVGELGSSYEVRQLANDYEEKYNIETVEEDAEAIREISRNWDVVEEHLQETTEWVRDEGLYKLHRGDPPIGASRDWEIEFDQYRIFDAERELKCAVDFSEYNTSLSEIISVLRNNGLLPSHYDFRLVLDESRIDMEYYIRSLVEAGASPAEAMDYYMVDVKDFTEAAWAEERGVDQSMVSDNVSQAKDKFKGCK